MNSAPSQVLVYDLDPDTENNVTITAETMGWSQLVIGNPADPSAKDNGYTKLTLEAEFKLSDDASPPLVEDRGSPFDLFVILRGSGGLTLDNPLMGSLPGQWNFYSLLLPGTPWDPEEVEELHENRTMYSWTVELYPGMAGDVKFTTSLEADLEFMDIPGMHLPLPDGATIGQSKIHLRAKPIHFLVSDPEPLPPAISIATGMAALKGISVAYEVLNDPAPLGAPTDPWLYVAAYEGVKYYRLVKNQDHYIVSAELVGTITRANAAGVLPISGQGSAIERCLFIYEEEEYNYITYWNSTAGEYGMMLAHATPIADACDYGSINNSPGFSSAQRTRAGFLDFNPATGRFEGSPTLVSLFFTNSFPGLTGEIVSCIAHNTTRAALIITSTGQIWVPRPPGHPGRWHRDRQRAILS
ncbi:MAG: hypothetical protein KJ970_02470 [Candidatus Eisenbacteria bacterium]|uniref:Uncharacterized protein n=1 Tax=Eiseniibacteriota bacterium TaxID=2212470 RepID=A0A948RRP1_UNCEI|nr:hypothetical protein [Candidatus Eisenbacteria bacterium]MBU1949103.1 hypothetical protein [Candidatus Eisenbacteria bacterium]MBU2689763.1 hypothetical protein [Candidatus Eisenbacteria bacterium]